VRQAALARVGGARSNGSKRTPTAMPPTKRTSSSRMARR
jgi:hypothetical protein